jgi:hypothetical protein
MNCKERTNETHVVDFDDQLVFFRHVLPFGGYTII